MPIPESPSFTDQVRNLVQRRNLPIEQVANLANLSRKTLYRWINGEVARPRHWSEVVALSRALRLNLTEVELLLHAARQPSYSELWEIARFEHETDLLESFQRAAPLQPEEPHRHMRPGPSSGTWATLENPEGAVRPESPFYIERDADLQLRSQALGNGTTTTVQAGRQSGKTSLLIQVMHTLPTDRVKIVYIDFQIMEDRARSDLSGLLQFLADIIAEQLDVAPSLVDNYWQNSHNPAQTFNRFLQNEILQPSDRLILLAIDEADILLDTTYKKHFFALLRAWDSRRAFDPLWRRLNLVIAISTQPYLLIDDVNLSPFNVGINLVIQDFNSDQIADLNRRHGNLLTPRELAPFMALVGGHPYLVRQALFTLAAENITLPRLIEHASEPDGAFGRHLRYYRYHLERNPILLEVLLQIYQGRSAFDQNAADRLSAVGLIKKEKNKWLPRCGLYAEFFLEQR